MVCEKCGTVNPPDSMFCADCGEKLEQEAYSNDRGEKEIQISINPAGAAVFLKKHIAAIIGIAVAIIALIVGINLLFYFSSPERTVEKYFEAVMEADWETAYELVYVNESDFINSEKYAEMMKNSDSVQENVASFEITKQSNRKSDRYSYYDEEDESEDEENDSLNSVYIVEYATVESASESMRIPVIRTGKKWLFFDEYRVSLASDIESYSFTAPDFVTVSFDEVVLEPKKTDDETKQGYYDTGNVFNGKYDVLIQSSLTEDYTTEAYDGLEISAEYLCLKEDEYKKIYNTAEEDFNRMFEDACNGKKYDKSDEISEMYQTEFYDQIYTSDKSGMYDCKILNTWNDTEYHYLSRDLVYSCTVGYEFSYNYQSYSTVKQYTADGSATLTYTYNDGKWELTAVSNYLYY